EGAEKPVVFVVDAGSEEERTGGCLRHAQAEHKRPESGDLDGVACRVGNGAQEVTGVEIEGIDRAIAEVSYKKRVGESSESLEGSPCHSPGGIELPLGHETLIQPPGGIEDIDEAVARSFDVILLVRILQRVRDIDLSVERGDAERRVSSRKLGVLKHGPVANERPVRIVDFD